MKLTSRLICVLVLTMALAAPVADAAKITLEWTTCCLQEDRAIAFQALANEYMRLNPNIEIQWSAPAGYANVIKTRFIAGTAPDVLWQGGALFEYHELLLPLNDLVAKDKNIASLNPVLLRTTNYLGQQIGLPLGAISSTMFYNKHAFAQAGLANPNRNWTFDDMLSMAKRLYVDSNGDGSFEQYGVGQMHRASDAWWATSWGSDFYTQDMKKTLVDNPVTTAAVQWYADHYNSKFVPFTGPRQTDNTIFNGRVAMNPINTIELPTMLSVANFDWDVQLLPQFVHDGKAYRNSQTNWEAWAISKSTKHPNEAKAFVQFLMSTEAQKMMGKAGFITPTNREAAQEFYRRNPPPANINLFLEALEYGSYYYMWHPIGTEIGKILQGSIWSDIFSGKTPASVGLPEIARQINLRLDEFNAGR